MPRTWSAACCIAALILPTDAVAEVRYQFVHDSLRSAGCRAKLFEGGRTKKISPHAIQDDGGAESFLLNGICLGHPAESSAQNFTDALQVVFRCRKRFKEIDRMAAVGVADVVFG
ncbi:MAG: hypothetical protein BGO12_03540 [Verrucomicrobia bacterium 61-8]|nr:MAG: hypothetical protein BGO12_03540 [Verrucomicrobia bacterium 61-8]